MALLTVGAQYRFSGNPNGNVAGQLGDQCKDTTTSGALYTCVTAGTTSSASWQLIGSGSGITYTALNNTIVIDNTARTVGGGYTAGTNVTIVGNVISAATGGSTVVQATNSTILVTNPTTGVYSVAGGYVAGSGIAITGNSISTTTGSLIRSLLANLNLVGGDGTPSVISGFIETTLFGENSGAALNSSSSYNTLIGAGAGSTLTAQQSNVAVGNRAMLNATCATSIAIGGSALLTNTGTGQVGIGLSSLGVSASLGDVAVGNNTGILMNAGTGGNTFIGHLAGSTQSNYSTTTLLGSNTDVTVSGLSNCGAFGANTTVSAMNAINLGNGAYIGINNPTPVYGIDPAPIGGVWGYAFPVSTVPPTSAKGSLWMDSSANMNYTNPAGTTVALNNNTSRLNLIPQQNFQTTGNIVLDNFSSQILLLGVIASGFSVIMPDPTMINPLNFGYGYQITNQYTNGASMGTPLTLLNSDLTPVVNPAGTAVTMQPGDTWVCWFTGVLKCKAYPIGNISFT